MTRLTAAPTATIAGWDVEIDTSVDRDQDQELLHLTKAGQHRHIRFHDYEALFDIPGLYDWVFYEALGCRAHEIVADAVHRELLSTGVLEPRHARVVDLGAGNGIISRALRGVGVEHILGVDILDGARRAAHRDSPQVYDDYLVADLGDMSPATHLLLKRFRPNVLVSVAALGYGDIPPATFGNALRCLASPAIVVFTVKKDFLQPGSGTDTGTGDLAAALIDASSQLEVLDRRPFVHRASATGQQLVYECVVARRRDDALHQDLS